MGALNQLGDLGFRPSNAAAGAAWTRPGLVDPAVPVDRPQGLALVPAAVEMLEWKLRHFDR